MKKVEMSEKNFGKWRLMRTPKEKGEKKSKQWLKKSRLLVFEISYCNEIRGLKNDWASRWSKT